MSVSTPQQPSPNDLPTAIEHMRRSLREAKNALLNGGVHEFEERLKSTQEQALQLARTVQKGEIGSSEIQLLQKETLEFAAVLMRKRRHFEILRSVIAGPSTSYSPQGPGEGR